MKMINNIHYDYDTTYVTCGAGATWRQIIENINKYGRSPVSLQSYSTFSVGGSISVNAHGILSKDPVSAGIVDMVILTNTNNKITVKTISKESYPELFSLIVGGYGCAGIILSVRLKTRENLNVDLNISTHNLDSLSEIFYKFPTNNKCEYIVFDITTFDKLNLITINEKPFTENVISKLNSKMSDYYTASFMNSTFNNSYSTTLWNKVRNCMFSHNINIENGTNTLNEFIYESDNNISIRYNEQRETHTFLLQEYFVPICYSYEWLLEIIHLLRNTISDDIILGNLTIRYINKNNDSYLSYSPNCDMLAFVLYFSVNKYNNICMTKYSELCNTIIHITQKKNGKFYLPYTNHLYLNETILQFYDMDGFVNKLKKYKSPVLYSNNLLTRFGHKLHQENYNIYNSDSLQDIQIDEHMLNQIPMLDYHSKLSSNDLIEVPFIFGKSADNNKQNNSGLILSTLSNSLKYKFTHNIIPYIIGLPDISDIIYKTNNNNFESFYKSILSEMTICKAIPSNALKLLVQNKLEARELTDITIKLLNDIGTIYSSDLLSIGNTSTISLLQSYLKIDEVSFITHDNIIMDWLRSGSVKYLTKRYSDINQIKNKFNLITAYEGLHHVPLDKLNKTITEIYDKLNDGGIFVLREHDVKNYSDLNVAIGVHTLFNLVTGSSYETEINELRNFRSLDEWIRILESHGFIHKKVYGYQQDKSNNTITIFKKQGVIIPKIDRSFTYYKPVEWYQVYLLQTITNQLTTLAWYQIDYFYLLNNMWKLLIDSTKTAFAQNDFSFYPFIILGLSTNILTTLFISPIAIGAKLLSLSGFGQYSPPNYEYIEVQGELTKIIDDCVPIYSDNNTHIYKVQRFKEFSKKLINIVDIYKLKIIRISNTDNNISFTLRSNANIVLDIPSYCTLLGKSYEKDSEILVSYALKINKINDLIEHLLKKHSKDNIQFYDYY
jgi:hypothetical protein